MSTCLLTKEYDFRLRFNRHSFQVLDVCALLHISDLTCENEQQHKRASRQSAFGKNVFMSLPWFCLKNH